MVFSSLIFILYFLPAFLLCYYWVPKPYKNAVILIFSILFYSWGAPKFIFVILGTTFLDFHLVRWMDSMQNLWHRRWLLLCSLSINLGLLFYFKYSNFFIENVNVLLQGMGLQSIHWTRLVLPIGISFYTFETITYVVDVYRKVHKPLHHFWDYQTYIILFPKLIAGPIIRYHDLADQINDRSTNENTENRLTGFYRFCLGLAKKVILANHMGLYADEIFNSTGLQWNTGVAWAGLLAYTFQIYFDFSGYSDMAIGIAKMIGFRFPENFDNPYISTSITEFWRRWHMTLGSWMKNYLYIPLGGNRSSNPTRIYFNLGLVFLASGLWHGASWNFIIWGIYHGFWLILERKYLLNIYDKYQSTTGRILKTMVCFLLVMLGWVFFRVETLPQAMEFFKALFGFSTNEQSLVFTHEYWFYVTLCVLFAFFAMSSRGQYIQQKIFQQAYSLTTHYWMAFISFVLLALSMGMITASGFNPFIYFRF